MIYWNNFLHNGVAYPLNHLHPELWVFTQPAKGDKPAINYTIRVIYSLHTFTTKEVGDRPYSDNRETRNFCFNRYDDSKVLPQVIKAIGNGYVFHTGRDNFLRIDQGLDTEYEVFFTAIKSKEKNADIQLYIQSAYLRTRGDTPRAGKIRFSVIAFNIMRGKKIKPHRR